MKGSYALALHLPADKRLTVGRLGGLQLPAGYYLYFGSALNSLEGRLRRHLTPEKKQHWHIDFLTAVAQIVQVWWTNDNKKKECSWTRRSLENASINVPVPGFGSSDCRACPAHLVHAPFWDVIQQVSMQLASDSPAGSLHIGNGFKGTLRQLLENPVS